MVVLCWREVYIRPLESSELDDFEVVPLGLGNEVGSDFHVVAPYGRSCARWDQSFHQVLYRGFETPGKSVKILGTFLANCINPARCFFSERLSTTAGRVQ